MGGRGAGGGGSSGGGEASRGRGRGVKNPNVHFKIPSDQFIPTLSYTTKNQTHIPKTNQHKDHQSNGQEVTLPTTFFIYIRISQLSKEQFHIRRISFNAI